MRLRGLDHAYLSERTQFVQIDNDFSHHHKLSCGVPQFSGCTWNYTVEPLLIKRTPSGPRLI